jgi:hypothetical protein
LQQKNYCTNLSYHKFNFIQNLSLWTQCEINYSTYVQTPEMAIMENNDLTNGYDTHIKLFMCHK